MSDALTELPEGWQWVTFSDLIEKIKRGPSKKCNTEGKGIRYITSGNLQNGELRLDLDYKFLDDMENIDICRLKSGDLILNCVNSLERIGKSAVFEQHHGEAIVGFNNYALELRCDCIIPNYANICCQSELFQNQLYFLVKKAINQVSFATKELSLIKIPLPPINEQKRIVAKIEELRDRHQRVKQALETIPELCDRFRQSVLAAAFRGDLTADWREQNPDVEPASVLLGRTSKELGQDFEQTVEEIDKDTQSLPNPWAWAKFKLFVKRIQAGKNFSCPEVPVTEDTVGLVKISAVTWGKFNPEETKTVDDLSKVDPNLFIQKGDFLISRANTIELVGASVVVHEINYKIMLSDKVWRVDFLETDKRFINFYLKSLNGRKEIESRATGNQLSMRNISQNAFKDIAIALPPLREQQEIANQIENVFHSIDRVLAQYNTTRGHLDGLNQSILAKAFRGELVEQDSNDEPASVLLDRIRAEREKSSKSTKGRGSKASKGTAEQITLPDTE